MLRLSLVAVLAAVANAKLFVKKGDPAFSGTSTLSIDGAEIVGPGTDDSGANCRSLSKAIQQNAKAPCVKVCGQSHKAIIHPLNDCESYGGLSTEVGTCDSAKSQAECQEICPGGDGATPGMQHFQSYEFVPCGEGSE